VFLSISRAHASREKRSLAQQALPADNLSQAWRRRVVRAGQIATKLEDAQMSAHLVDAMFCWKFAAQRLGAIVLCASFFGPMSTAMGQPRHHVLDVYGEGFSFAVKEPPGWFADTTIASEFAANVIFYPVTGDPHSPGTPTIRVVVSNKISEHADAVLNHDIEQYRSRYQNVKFGRTVVTHRRYRASAKRFCVPDEFCDYVTHLNPGRDSRVMLSATLHRPTRPATAVELIAYQRVVASLDGVVAENGK
jgi:hypothetical protein